MKDVILSYLSSLKYREKNTAKTYEQGIKGFVKAVGIEAPLDLETYIKFLKSLDDRSAGSQRVYKAAVTDLYKFYGDEYKQTVDLIAMDRANKRYLRKEEKEFTFNRDAVNILLDYANKLDGDLIALRDRAFIITLRDTGLRISEACNLKRGDIDWKNNTYVTGKGNRRLMVYFSAKAISAIKRYLSARAQLDGATGLPLSSLPLFARHDQAAWKKIKRVGTGGMWKAFTNRMREAGIEEKTISPHKLRHEAITRFYEKTKDIKKTKEFGRHKRIDTTDRYTHIVNKDLEKAYNEVFNEGVDPYEARFVS